ncbi:MAG TPA: DUF6152 family protein [Steroidobacter sp.]|uniref:DUF6152 family protein n=1 Tax=Steroidobacter sp. TaxID=1978227 RepID=UPI002ED944E5
MNIRISLALSATLASMLLGSAQAHHSFAAMYDANKPVRLVGKLVKVEWTNPHSYFHLEVTGKDGNVSNWACEGAGPGALSRRGFNKSDIKIGDTLIVDGYLAKAGGKIIDARRVTLPDGKVVSGGTPGDGGPGEAAGARPPRS